MASYSLWLMRNLLKGQSRQKGIWWHHTPGGWREFWSTFPRLPFHPSTATTWKWESSVINGTVSRDFPGFSSTLSRLLVRSHSQKKRRKFTWRAFCEQLPPDWMYPKWWEEERNSFKTVPVPVIILKEPKNSNTYRYEWQGQHMTNSTLYFKFLTLKNKPSFFSRNKQSYNWRPTS